jgi:signal transduction histidine kinase
MVAERSHPVEPGWPVERVLDWIQAGCLLFDRRAVCVYANEAGSALFGLARDGLVGRELRSPFSTPLASALQRALLAAFASGTPTRVTLHDEPTGRWLDAAMHPSAEGLLAIVADVTAEKRAALEDAAHHEYLRQLVDQIPAFLWVIDHDLIVRRVEGGRAMLEALDPDRIIGLPMVDVTRMGSTPEDLKLSVDMHRRVLQGAPAQYRATWKGIVVEARIRPLRDRDGAIVGILGIGVDVTKEADLEAQLRRSQKLEALGQLAGGVAHDFNNVLAAISGYAHLLFEDLGADPHRHDVAEILKAADRATSITRQLLAFSRQQVPTAARLDLVDLVHDLSRMLRALLPATIDLRVSPERGGPPIEVLADRGQIEQVIMNLTVNARDAMAAGGTLSVDVRTGTTPETAQSAVIEVRDTGVGMSPEVQAHVFEPFFTTKEPGRGTGLGLATVYGIVQQHGGTIDIASAAGEGTTVTVRLAIAAPGAPPAVTEPEGAYADHGGRVLVVEDEAQVRDVTARFLRRAGYEVVAVIDAATALGLLASDERFDLVLTDSAMPGMRGEDLAGEIARARPGLPVVLMSGYLDPARPATAAPVAAFVQKPFRMAALLAVVRRLIARDPPS